MRALCFCNLHWGHSKKEKKKENNNEKEAVKDRGVTRYSSSPPIKLNTLLKSSGKTDNLLLLEHLSGMKMGI
jgi:hypothetical protein